MFSVNTEAEAKALLTMTCPTNRHGQYVAPELATEQTLDNLYAFGDRLQQAWEELNGVVGEVVQVLKKPRTKRSRKS